MSDLKNHLRVVFLCLLYGGFGMEITQFLKLNQMAQIGNKGLFARFQKDFK